MDATRGVLDLLILRKREYSYLEMRQTLVRYIDACEQTALCKTRLLARYLHGGCTILENVCRSASISVLLQLYLMDIREKDYCVYCQDPKT